MVTLPNEGSEKFYQAFPVPVLAADDSLPNVLEVPMLDGRWLRAGDGHNHTRVAGAGRGPREAVRRDPRRDPHDPAQRGGLRRRRRARIASRSTPISTTRCSSPQWAAKHDFATEGRAEQALRPRRRRRDAGDGRRDPDRDQPRRSRVGVDEDPERRAPGVGAGRQDAAADRAVRGHPRPRRRRARDRERHVDLGDPAIVGDRHPARRWATPAR